MGTSKDWNGNITQKLDQTWSRGAGDLILKGDDTVLVTVEISELANIQVGFWKRK